MDSATTHEQPNGGLGGTPVGQGAVSVLQSQHGTDHTPRDLPANWRCPDCGGAEVLLRWEALGSQLGVVDADGRFRATEEAAVYECEPSAALTCAACDTPVPDENEVLTFEEDLTKAIRSNQALVIEQVPHA
jgi:hypothetical protein